jgi:L-lactate dehydrogenase complex protein LldG
MNGSLWDEAINRVLEPTIIKTKNILNNYKYLYDIAEKLRKAKEEVIKNFDYYIEQTIRSIEQIGGFSYLARDANEARRIVGEIVGSGKKIVMSKSMVAYEVGLRPYLISKGNEVWETDLGEFLIQLADEPPSHLLAPALHMTKERVAKLLKEKIDQSIDENKSIEELVNIVRNFLRSKFFNADIGISGANVIAADTGAVLTIENEGNIRMTSIIPPVNIVVTGIDKIVPTLEFAFYEVMIQSAFGTMYPPTYVNLSAGPSSTADIEIKRVRPAQGPKEFHVILVDNGRSKAAKDPILWEALLCIRCGRCYFHCPIYRNVGPSWGIPPYNGPTGVMWNAVIHGVTNENVGKTALLCAHSGGCKEVCPMKINITEVIHYIKRSYLKIIRK